MAWSGGTFTGLHNWVTDQSNAIKILASRHKAQDDVFIAGINSCIEKSGSNAMTGNFDAGSNRLTSLAAATAATDAPIASQIQDGSLTYAVDTGSANAYAISLTPNETAYAAGQVFFFKATNANSGASTLNVDSIGAIDIKKYHNVALVSGDIVENQIVGVVYDATTLDFVMITPTPTAPITTTTAAQTNITSLGTLTSLTIDNLTINGNTITADSGALNLTPASGSAIVFDGTINVDAGEVTGATSITSTAFVGDITGDVTGNASGTAATVTGAAQTNITSVGTLTSLAVTGEVTATGFTGTLDGILGSGAPAAASVTTLAVSGAISGASFKDEDDMSSDSATAVASQQSIKAYVDTEVAGAGGGGMPAGYITNADLVTGADADHDIDFPAIICRDTANTKDITTSAYTKQGDAAFAEGTAAGMLADSVTLPASGTIHFFIIEKDAAAGTFDYMADTSVTGATGVSGWTVRRRVGSRTTDGSSNIIKVIQHGDDHELDVAQLDANAANPGTSAVLTAVSVPDDLKVIAKLSFYMSDTTPSGGPTYMLVTDPATTDTTPTSVLYTTQMIDIHGGNAYTFETAQVDVRTDTSMQIRTRQDNSTATHKLVIFTRGWIDRRGRD